MADRKAERERAEKATALVWTRLEGAPRTAGRAKPALSLPKIVRAALDLADAEGIDALSMRSVAKRLGAGTMSLYRHVATRDELIDLMTDEVLGEAPLPATPSGHWRADLTALARGLRQMVHRHPWVVRHLSRPSLGPNFRARTEFALAAVDGFGLGIDAMLDVVGTVNAFTLGFVQDELADHEARQRTGLTEEEWHEQIAPFVQQVLSTGAYPRLARVVAAAEDQPDMDEIFERRLGYVLAGLSLTLRP